METVGSLVSDPGFLAFARFSVLAFFAIVFLQSGLNKLADSEGNLAYFQEQFRQAPTLQSMLGSLFWALTAMEIAAGALCALGLITFSFVSGGFLARWGIRLATLALLCLMFGQRMAKDYAGAAVVAAYFAVAMLGLLTFSIGR
jgi:hypothetical protein